MEAIQLRRITSERDRANRISDFMTTMFRVADPSETRGNSVTAREILDRAAKDIETGLARDPSIQAQMMDLMGSVYSSLGLYASAQPLLERAVEIWTRTVGADDPRALASKHDLADVEKLPLEFGAAGDRFIEAATDGRGPASTLASGILEIVDEWRGVQTE